MPHISEVRWVKFVIRGRTGSLETVFAGCICWARNVHGTYLAY